MMRLCLNIPPVSPGTDTEYAPACIYEFCILTHIHRPDSIAYQPCLVREKFFFKSVIISITSNLALYVWNIKCRRKKKLIAQFGWKLRDERFEPN